MTKQQKVEIDLPDRLPPKVRKQLADDIIEFIVDRTQKGLDKNNKKFPGYSDSYVKSLDFKIAGKRRSKVDLQLSGDMLAGITLLTDKPDKLVIGFEKGDELNDRAEGNILGSYGGDPNPKRARDFLGISDKDLKRLARPYLDE